MDGASSCWVWPGWTGLDWTGLAAREGIIMDSMCCCFFRSLVNTPNVNMNDLEVLK